MFEGILRWVGVTGGKAAGSLGAGFREGIVEATGKALSNYVTKAKARTLTPERQAKYENFKKQGEKYTDPRNLAAAGAVGTALYVAKKNYELKSTINAAKMEELDIARRERQEIQRLVAREKSIERARLEEKRLSDEITEARKNKLRDEVEIEKRRLAIQDLEKQLREAEKKRKNGFKRIKCN